MKQSAHSMRGHRAEPLERDGTIGKLGLDATRHPGDRQTSSPPRHLLPRPLAAWALLQQNGVALARRSNLYGR